MATALEYLKVEDLTPDELGAALDCAKQVSNLKFQSRATTKSAMTGKGWKSLQAHSISKFARWSRI